MPMSKKIKGKCNTRELQMPIIRASCPTCGDVELQPIDLTISVCSTTGDASYIFRCESCAALVPKAADRQVVEVLVSSGVKMTFWRLPAELEDERSGPPIEIDDLISFHYELESADWRDSLDQLESKRFGFTEES